MVRYIVVVKLTFDETADNLNTRNPISFLFHTRNVTYTLPQKNKNSQHLSPAGKPLFKNVEEKNKNPSLKILKTTPQMTNLYLRKQSQFQNFLI